MKIRWLRYFLEALKHESFSQAANALDISQPTLTRSIGIIEQIVQRRLFERTTKGVRPTAAGRVLRRHAVLVIDQIESAKKDLGSVDAGEVGVVTVGVDRFFISPWFDEAIAEFTEERPCVHVSIESKSQADLTRALKDGKLDFVLSADPGAPDSFVFESLGVRKFCIAAESGSSVFDTKVVGLKGLLAFHWVTLDHPDMEAVVQDIFGSADLRPPEDTVCTGSVRMLRSLIQTGRYIGILPVDWAIDDIKSGRLREVPVGANMPEKNVGLVVSCGANASSSALELMDSIRRSADALPG